MSEHDDITDDQLVVTAREGYWFHHLDVPGELTRRARPDLALEVCRSLIDRWADDPRGEEHTSRVVVVDLLAALHPHPGVVDLLRQLAHPDTPDMARRRAVEHLVGLDRAAPDAHTAGGPHPQPTTADVVRALHARGAHDEARATLRRYGGGPGGVWWWGGIDDMRTLSTGELHRTGTQSRWWFERSWAGRVLVQRGAIEEGLAALTGAFGMMAPSARGREDDAALTDEPTHAVAMAAAHLDHPAGQDAIVAAATNDWHVLQQRAVAAIQRAPTRLDAVPLARRLATHSLNGCVAAAAIGVHLGDEAVVAAALGPILAHARSHPAGGLANRLAYLGAPAAAVHVASATVLSGWSGRAEGDLWQALRILRDLDGPEAQATLRRVAADPDRLLAPLSHTYRAAAMQLLG